MVRDRIDKIQKTLLLHVDNLDDQILRLYKEKGAEAAVQFATQFSVNTANIIHQEWFDFYGELFVRFRDFHVITADPGEPSCECNAQEPGLSEAVKKRIIDETGNHYEVSSCAGVRGSDLDEQLLRAVQVQ